MSVAVVLIVISCLCHQLPEVFAQKSNSLLKELKICKSGDNVCLKDAIASALQLLRNGLPSHGIVGLNPIHVKTVAVDIDLQSIGFKAKVADLDVYGFDAFKLTSAKGEFGNKTYRLDVSGLAPNLTLLGDYTADGMVFNIPFRGTGKCNFTFTDIDAKLVFTGKVVKKKGVDHVRIEACKINFTTKHLSIYLSDLFNGNKLLTQSINAVFNDNWQLLLTELLPTAEDIIENILREVAFQFYDKIPYKMLHP